MTLPSMIHPHIDEEAITDQETDLVVLQSRSGVCSGTIGYPSKFPQCKVNIRAVAQF